jgi:anti-sigma factor ChrR (cupin superfamily)
VRLNADRAERIVVDIGAQSWAASPEDGVDRIMLDREGGELARATSIVRYAPGTRFRQHEHGQGEEFLVLEGEFRDEHGVYPAGTYVRNPWGTRHGPFSPRGCLLFVKLRQVPRADTRRVVVEPAAARGVLGGGPGVHECVLHASAHERVTLVRWPAAHAEPRHDHPHGEEILVLEGGFADRYGAYGARTWLRQPAGSAHAPSTRTGCLMWIKRGLL